MGLRIALYFDGGHKMTVSEARLLKALDEIHDRLTWTPCAKDGCAHDERCKGYPHGCPFKNTDDDDVNAAREIARAALEAAEI
jgi:hypothetical protein